MRNVMILGSAFHIGGAERVIANLARYIDRRSFHVTLCHLKERGLTGEELAREGFELVGVPRETRGLKRYLSFLSLARIIRERGIQLVHTHTTYALIDACLCRLFANRGLKVVHTFHFGNYPHYPPRYKALERIFSRVATQLIAVGYEQRKTICETYGLPERRIRTIVNGVDAPAPTPDAEWSQRLAAEGAIVIGTICTFIEQKGLPDLVEVAGRVCRKHDNVRFVVVGDGPLRVQLEQRARELGIADKLLFAGWKTQAAQTMLPLFDIFFQPSLWEAMSMVVLEAMAANKPVVVTDVGDNRHAVRHGVTGLVVEKRNHEQMAEALNELIESPAKRQAFGAAGRSRYDELYDVRTMTRSYETLFDELLGQPPAAARAATGNVLSHPDR